MLHGSHDEIQYEQEATQFGELNAKKYRDCLKECEECR
jgi:hypothetical protein